MAAETAKPVTKVWKSGDFLDTPRNAPPYNGLEITGTYTPDADGTVDRVKVTFTDYTLVKDGLSSVIPALTVGDGWTDVPPAAGDDFTVVGQVRIQVEPNGRFLRIRLSYGRSHVRDELGFIFQLI